MIWTILYFVLGLLSIASVIVVYAALLSMSDYDDITGGRDE